MPQKCRQPGPHPLPFVKEVQVRREFVPEPVLDPQSQRHGHRALGKIKNEHEDAKGFSQHPSDVGGSDVAAAMLEDINPAPAADQVTERQAADQVAKQNNQDEQRVHGLRPGRNG